jgi:hypothetical protein
MSATAIEFIRANPRSTAKEAGLTIAEANSLVGQGKLLQAGKRVTGQKGRPPTEFVTPDYDVSDDALAQEAVEAARKRVNDHRRFERLSGNVMRAANEFGHGSEQHVAAKLDRAEVFGRELPPLPSKNDYVLAGVIVEHEALGLLEDEEALLAEAGE